MTRRSCCKKNKRKGIADGGNSKRKGPGAEKTFKYLRSKNECNMPGECCSSLSRTEVSMWTALWGPRKLGFLECLSICSATDHPEQGPT